MTTWLWSSWTGPGPTTSLVETRNTAKTMMGGCARRPKLKIPGKNFQRLNQKHQKRINELINLEVTNWKDTKFVSIENNDNYLFGDGENRYMTTRKVCKKIQIYRISSELRQSLISFFWYLDEGATFNSTCRFLNFSTMSSPFKPNNQD